MQKTILFFGDSITDCGRNYEDIGSMGIGYALFTKLQLGTDFPNEYTFLNKGINGNRVLEGCETCNTEQEPDRFERFKQGVAEKEWILAKIKYY